jgi:hypothetical protein
MPQAAGSRVSRTGTYRVTHHGHRQPHEATLRKGETFPRCSVCGGAVMFEFIEALGKIQPEHIGYDSNFVRSVMKKPKSA